jgi:hypothetical protein
MQLCSTAGVANMIESTFENHYKFGYNGQFFTDRTSVSDRWFFSLGNCTQPQEFLEEAVRAAKLLQSRNPDVALSLCMSGGVDSELCAHVFFKAGINFSCVIANWSNTNLYDINTAVEYCESNRISYEIRMFDLVKFYEGPAAAYYAKITQADNPYLLPYMWLMDQTGFPILGNGEPDIYLNSLNSWVCSFKEQVATWHKFLIKSSKRGCGGFWEYTPDLMLSYLDAILSRPEIRQKAVTDFKKLKPRLFYDLAGLRIRPKYSGFEGFHKLYAGLVSRLGKQLQQQYPRPGNPDDKSGHLALKNSIEVDVYVLREMLIGK